jgi:hypothetical protein
MLVVDFFAGVVTLTLALSRRGRGDSNPRWPGTQDLEEADKEGVELLGGAKKLFQANPCEKRARTGF